MHKMKLQSWARKYCLLGHLGKLIGYCETEYLLKLCMGLYNDDMSFEDKIYAKEHEIKVVIHIY